MAYVIWNVDQKKSTRWPAGSKHSFTKYLQHARIFKTRDAAQSDCCGNEFPRSAEAEMGFGE